MGHRVKVLIVDDEESLRFTFEVFLSDAGYHVETARTYDEGLAAVCRDGFELVFVDIFLQGRSGLDLVREVRARNMHCQVVVITGAPSEESASDAFSLGIFDYIPKPVRKDRLLQVAKEALEGR